MIGTKHLLTLAGGLFLVGGVSAAFIEGDSPISTVAEALKMKDDTPVVLQGRITQHLHKDKYQFTDKTGNITVEIDHKAWNGTDVRASDTVELYGEIDKDWYSTEVDVHSLKIVP